MNHYVFLRVILILLMASTSGSAQQYTSKRTGEAVVLEDTTNQTAVSILPAVGNIAFSMKVKAQDILRWLYASIQ